VSDGETLFASFPADTHLPMLEWGINYLFAERLGFHLLLHAGAAELNGRGVILPALPGSGKSNLTAALATRGFRLLSDEFGVVRFGDGQLLPLLRPVALKNESIDAIAQFSPHAWIGRRFPKTRKGTVAHLAPDEEAVRRRHEPARPARIVFSRYDARVELAIELEEPSRAFDRVAVNSFNYEMLGPAGRLRSGSATDFQLPRPQPNVLRSRSSRCGDPLTACRRPLTVASRSVTPKRPIHCLPMKSTRHLLAGHKRVLLEALACADSCVPRDDGGWDPLVRTARSARLVGVLAVRIERAGLMLQVSQVVANHLRAASAEAHYLRQMSLRQLAAVADTLRPVGAGLLALKGSAYILRNSLCAARRIPRDVDIMVGAAVWTRSNKRCFSRGGRSRRPILTAITAHCKELPPMRVPAMPFELDVHHTILPPLGRLRADAQSLFAAAAPVADPNWWTLCPTDLVLHAAAHLFQDSGWIAGLRDLVDIDSLVREAAVADPRLWEVLGTRVRNFSTSGAAAVRADIGKELAWHARCSCFRRNGCTGTT